MKYRIKQIGDWFYAQRRILGFWRNIHVRVCSIRYDSINKKEPGCYKFRSLEHANNFIINYKNNYTRPFMCRRHMVKCFYDDESNKFVYVDMPSLETRIPRYNYSSGDLCAEIANFEDARISKKKHDNKVTIHEFTED